MDQTTSFTAAKGLSINESQKYLGGVSHQTLYRLINGKVLRTYKVGRRRFIYLDSLNDYVQNHTEV
tara:strand:+ start:595 stop:792 length:198 start_codon:yes stop_codon:yes gene_type:complete